MCASHKSLNLNKKNDLKSAVTLTNNITHITQTDSAFLPSANDAVWNVKSIRPYDMKPYTFENENYSKLGYVYEGVTTYMGDLYLLKSGVFSLDAYLQELERQFQTHFDNQGR